MRSAEMTVAMTTARKRIKSPESTAAPSEYGASQGDRASSTGRCNTGLLKRSYLLFESLGWGLPLKGLAGPVVERVSDGLEVFGGPARQVGALGEVLAQQPVRVFVRRALPR